MRDKLATWVGVGVLALFGGTLLYMLTLIGASEREWMRAASLFAGLEAMAFAAAGYLFGRAVHRGQAEERGRILAGTLREMLRERSKEELGGGRSSDLGRLIELADRLYPEAGAAKAKRPSKAFAGCDTT